MTCTSTFFACCAAVVVAFAGVGCATADMHNNDAPTPITEAAADTNNPVTSSTVVYEDAGTTLEAYVATNTNITGPRPGEKLFEELAYHGEDMLPTPHESIRLWRTGSPDTAQMQQIISTFDRLRDKAGDGSRRWRDAPPRAVVTALRSLLPEMVQSVAV